MWRSSSTKWVMIAAAAFRVGPVSGNTVKDELACQAATMVSMRLPVAEGPESAAVHDRHIRFQEDAAPLGRAATVLHVSRATLHIDRRDRVVCRAADCPSSCFAAKRWRSVKAAPQLALCCAEYCEKGCMARDSEGVFVASLRQAHVVAIPPAPM